MWSLKFTKSKALNFAKKLMEWNSNLICKSWWLTFMRKNQVNICKHLKKKIQKTVWMLKFTKSKAHNFAKNQWCVKKLKLDM